MTCRRSQVRVLYRPPQKSSDFRLRIFCLVAVQDSNRAALTTPVGRVSNQPSGLLLSPRFPTRRNVYRDDCRFVVGGTGLEQQRRRPPPAAETGSRGWDSVLIFQSPAKGLQKNQQTQPVRPCVAGQAISPAGCCLVRGSQRVGMSNNRLRFTVHREDSSYPFLFFIQMRYSPSVMRVSRYRMGVQHASRMGMGRFPVA